MEMPHITYLQGTEGAEDPTLVIPESDFIRLMEHVAELESLLQGLADLDDDMPACIDKMESLMNLEPKVWAKG